MRPKVIKITTSSADEDHTLFENGVFLKKPFVARDYIFNEKEESKKDYTMLLNITLSFNFNRTYKRDGKITCGISSREHTKGIGKSLKRVDITINPKEMKKELLDLITEQEKTFYLSENELISAAHELLKNQFKYTYFQREVEIDGCIADGLAFIGASKDYRHAKIIGFEAKTNRDVFDRLYNQINSYLTICDEVYLIVESKEPPRDLPFYVGIIKVKEGVPQTMRRATSLKHSIDVHDCWKTLLKNLCTHVGIKRDSEILEFFDIFENIKRKLVWNQFVIGFHQTFVEDYVPLTKKEKRLLKCYFGVQMEIGDEKEPITYKTLEDFFGKGK